MIVLNDARAGGGGRGAMRDRFDIQGLVFLARSRKVIVGEPRLLVPGVQASNALPRLHPTVLGAEIDRVACG
jgi:hypothetical protein